MCTFDRYMLPYQKYVDKNLSEYWPIIDTLLPIHNMKHNIYLLPISIFSLQVDMPVGNVLVVIISGSFPTYI